MVVYECNNCLKQFIKKDDFIKHTEKRKKSCKKIENLEDFSKISKLNENNENNENNQLKCNYCLKIFSNIYNLKKHQNGHCKVKKLDEERKEEIFNKLIEREEKFEILLNNFENLQKYTEGLKYQNETLQNQIKDLERKFKEQMKEQTKSYDHKIKQIITKNVNNNSNNTINNNITNNFIIPHDKLVTFGKEDLRKISWKLGCNGL